MSHMFQDLIGKNDSTDYCRGIPVELKRNPCAPQFANPLASGKPGTISQNPPRQIESSLEILESKVDRIQDRVKLLEHRLGSVLRGVPPADCGAGPSCADISVPLSARLNGQAQILDKAGDALDSIISRLEL